MRGFNFLKLWLFVFHNTDTFPSPLLAFALSVVINWTFLLIINNNNPSILSSHSFVQNEGVQVLWLWFSDIWRLSVVWVWWWWWYHTPDQRLPEQGRNPQAGPVVSTPPRETLSPESPRSPILGARSTSSSLFSMSDTLTNGTRYSAEDSSSSLVCVYYIAKSKRLVMTVSTYFVPSWKLHRIFFVIDHTISVEEINWHMLGVTSHN